MIKESSISFWQGKVLSHFQSIQTTSEASPVPCLICARGQEATTYLCLVLGLRMCAAIPSQCFA